MPRFVVLRHDSPQGLHFDLMLETGEALRTWALPEPPGPGVEMIGDALPDHRPAYLDYEGPVSGGRGWVTRFDRGTYRIERQGESELIVELAGEQLAGRATLCRLPEEPSRWRFSFTAD